MSLARLASLILAAALLDSNGAEAANNTSLRSQQVGPHTYFVEGVAGAATRDNRGFNSNAGFVITAEGVVVFDALGTPDLGRELVAEIRRLTSVPIRRVILSHYHADHAYGVPALRAAGAEVWIHRDGRIYLSSELARTRLAQRREALSDWIDEDFQLSEPDRWLEGDVTFTLGGVTFDVRHVGPAHSPEDLSLLVLPDGVLFAGDLVFEGRIPFLGDADSATWLSALDKLDDPRAKVLAPGHGSASDDAAGALRLTRDYLSDLRSRMRNAVESLQPFEEAFGRADWSQWEKLPAYAEAHRGNVYAVYLEMERESLEGPPSLR